MVFNSYFPFSGFPQPGDAAAYAGAYSSLLFPVFVLCCRFRAGRFFRDFSEKVGNLPEAHLLTPVIPQVWLKFFVEIPQIFLLYDFGRAGNTVTAPKGVIHTQEEHYAGKSRAVRH